MHSMIPQLGLESLSLGSANVNSSKESGFGRPRTGEFGGSGSCVRLLTIYGVGGEKAVQRLGTNELTDDFRRRFLLICPSCSLVPRDQARALEQV